MNVASAFANARDSVELVIAILEDTVKEIDRHTATTSQMRHFICRSLLRAGQLLDSSSILSARYRYQDIWVLGRTLTELTINICYLQIAPEIEFKRWSNYDLWTDERLISNLSLEIPTLEAALDPKELEQQRKQRKSLEDSGIYQAARRGTWSEKMIDERAKIADIPFKLAPNILQLLYRLPVKIGDGFVHSSPKALGPQRLPVASRHDPSAAEIHSTAQALSMAATSVLAAITFTRSHFDLAPHPLADRLGYLLRGAFDDSKPF